MAKIVRRHDFAGGGITDEERAQMAEHTKLWTARAFRTTPIEPDKIIPAIQGVYRAANLPPPRVVIVPSPLVMALAGGFAAAVWYMKKNAATDDATYDATDDATRDATDDATDDATYAATRDATDDATDDATRDATDDATYDATRDATDDATRAATDAATRDATDAATYAATGAATDDATYAATYSATRDATDAATGAAHATSFFLRCASYWWRMYQGGNMWSPLESYLTAVRDVLGVKLPQHKDYLYWEQAAIHGGFRIMHEEFCMVSDFPERLLVDDQNRPHCEDGPSHRWRDGWAIYHWHGVAVPQSWIEDGISATDALKEVNLEKRRAACEIVGWDKILSELNAVTVDRDEDPMVGELVEVDLPDVGREKFLRVLCATGRNFALPVPPEMMTALEANAWTYDIPQNIFQKMETRT